MITLILILAIIVVGWGVNRRYRTKGYHEYGPEIAGSFTMLCGAIVLLIYIAAFGMMRYVVHPTSIERFKATQETVYRARQGGQQLEDAALQQKVVEQNQWLAEQKWWRGTDIWFFIPPEVDELEPIE